MRPWDSLERRREAPLLADGRGLRRLPEPRRRPARTDARLPREVRAARQHADRARLGQRRVGRGRPERLGEREQALQRAARTRSRRHSSTSTSSGTPKTYNHYPTGWAWAFNTPFKMWKRYASYQGGTADPMIVSWPAQIKERGHPDAVHARDRHRADDLRAARRRAAGGRQRLHAAPARGRELRGEPARRGREGQADAVLLDARHPRHLPRRLEGRAR